jgi:hypothetical protein
MRRRQDDSERFAYLTAKLLAISAADPSEFKVLLREPADKGAAPRRPALAGGPQASLAADAMEAFRQRSMRKSAPVMAVSVVTRGDASPLQSSHSRSGSRSPSTSNSPRLRKSFEPATMPEELTLTGRSHVHDVEARLPLVKEVRARRGVAAGAHGRGTGARGRAEGRGTGAGGRCEGGAVTGKCR